VWRDSDGFKEISLAAVETTITATGAKSGLLFKSGVHYSKPDRKVVNAPPRK
jgi:hypothetical protein